MGQDKVRDKAMAQLKAFIEGRCPITFVDLFAGAGGISEGFLQASTDDKYYDFILASDINENCELTHRVRYNEQLGLDTQFITEDIMSPSFLAHLKEALGNKEIDVVTGGPSCQSFSLSGRRKRFDKRDGLFNHYLKVIRSLRPKYFVMENVKGLLTKDNGKFKVEIMREMRSIIDDKAVSSFLVFVDDLLKKTCSPFLASVFLLKFQMEIANEEDIAATYKEQFFDLLDNQLRSMTRQIDYRLSKSDLYISTIRHGLYLLRRNEQRDKITAEIINEKTASNIDNDLFFEKFNDFLATISDEEISSKIKFSIGQVEALKNASQETEELIKAVDLYSLSLDECFDELQEMAKHNDLSKKYDDIMSHLRLYNVEQMVLLSSDYGVPQNRERVVFIGSRNDQTPITSVPATVREEDKVTVYEAISDLDFIGNGEVCTNYAKPTRQPKYDGLLRRRKVDGEINDDGMTFAEWSKVGRLNHRFRFDCQPFYVKDLAELKSKLNIETSELFNHQTSAQNKTVMQRLKVIAECGGYTDECKAKLKEMGLESNKRNYFVLKADGQSPTVVTMPDDFIHYSRHRAMTVREMARLQSFDDSFVFQGKRQTGGDKRKSEIPQYTLVGNAVPPLMARAIGNEILKHIK
ncbi:MAG: DNA cytosine methyltransferase [Bacteroidales bacterium]|nr:DNA cytosine methyltransferase [Bacteroidales bacterium]